VLFDLVRQQNRHKTGGQAGRALVADFLATFALEADAGLKRLDVDVDRLIAQREQHRRNRRFADADRIRDQLAAHGVLLEDSRAGVRWRRSTQ
jgi:cysteinyl-tRNA synthetase